jgi:threonine/homoserine/homoserine lactone efflux protein
MLESILTMSLTGLIAGFIFAMPIAGPISILIVSNALKGRLRYSNMINTGAAFADVIYIFIAVYGLTKLYSFYKPAIPYLFLVGSVFFIILGIKIFRTRVDFEHFEEKSQITKKIPGEKGALYTGFMVNLLNPTLFLSALTSSFFVISFVASVGLNTGGLDLKIRNNVEEINSIEGPRIDTTQSIPFESLKKYQKNSVKKAHDGEIHYPPSFHFLISIVYAVFIAIGGFLWFYMLAYLLARYRARINIMILSGLIKGFGIILCILGLYFGYLGANHFLM